MGANADPIVLSVGVGSDGLGILLTRGGRAPVHGRLAPGRVGAITTPSPSPGLLLPGADTAMVAAERETGRALAELFAGPVDRALAEARASASPRLELLIDAQWLAELPWELLECAPAVSWSAAGARVVRVVPGGTHVPRGTGVEVWVPCPEDAACAEVAAALGPISGVRTRVLHVICHGETREGEMFLRLDGDRWLDAAGAVAVLRSRLADGPIVVLDVCGAGRAVEDSGASLPHRLVEAGATACIAPRCPFDAEASIAASRALYSALQAGQELAAAVDAMRGALAGLGMAHPAFRWWTPVLVVADARALRLGGGALAAAFRLGAAQGFVGVEHLALAFAREAEQLAPFASGLGAWARGSWELRMTPRVAAMVAALPEGYDDATLFAAFARARPVRMAFPLLGRIGSDAPPGGPTAEVDEPGPLPAMKPGSWLVEVIGGPEDGRQISMVEGDVLGRWDPARKGPATELFVEGPFDPAVSRRHLELKAGSLRPLAPVGREGDLLTLGLATKLLVLRRP